jgi:hypothetical protein
MNVVSITCTRFPGATETDEAEKLAVKSEEMKNSHVSMRLRSERTLGGDGQLESMAYHYGEFSHLSSLRDCCITHFALRKWRADRGEANGRRAASQCT